MGKHKAWATTIVVPKSVGSLTTKGQMKPTFRVNLTVSQAGENSQINAPEHTNVDTRNGRCLLWFCHPVPHPCVEIVFVIIPIHPQRSDDDLLLKLASWALSALLKPLKQVYNPTNTTPIFKSRSGLVRLFATWQEALVRAFFYADWDESYLWDLMLTGSSQSIMQKNLS